VIEHGHIIADSNGSSQFPSLFALRRAPRAARDLNGR
jgi:hypothetical protein